MPADKEKIADIVRRGISIFATVAPFPASGLVAAISAATISKIVEIHDRRISAVLSHELLLNHIPYVEPNEESLLRFYTRNPLYPRLANEFAVEISENQIDRLLEWYPFLYSALILKRQIPNLLFHKEIKEQRYRELALRYQEVSSGYGQIAGSPEKVEQIDQFSSELLEILYEVYEASKDELKNRENQLSFDLVDFIRDVATI